MTMPSADAVAALVAADLDAIPKTLPEGAAKLQSMTAIVKRIRDMVLAATVDSTLDGSAAVTTAPGTAPVTGTATGTIS